MLIIKEFFSQFKKGRRFQILGIFFLVVFFLLFLGIVSRRASPLEKRVSQITSSPQSSGQTPIQQEKYFLPSVPKSPPEISFGNYENLSTFPSAPEKINTFEFKTNYQISEILSLGARLGLTQYIFPDQKFVILYNFSDPQNRGMLTFERGTGAFTFQSHGVHKLGGDEHLSPSETARKFLLNLGVIDETVTCPITYQRQGLSGINFVECHRNWEMAGLPILGLPGILNVPESAKLESLRVGMVDENFPDDPTVTKISTGQNGKVRPDDFNTITVGVFADGGILSINSNLRQIATKKEVLQSQLLTPQEALVNFSPNNPPAGGQFSLTVPLEGNLEKWEEIYPQNQAKALKATISDYLLTFLEKPAMVEQKTLEPMYLIRGTAQLSSGYKVLFVQAVPAKKNSLSLKTPSEGEVAGTSTESSKKTLKLGTETQEETQEEAPDSGTIPFRCTLPKGFRPAGEVALEIPGLGRLVVFQAPARKGPGYSNIFPHISPHTFYLKSASFPVSSMEQVRDAFFKAVEEQMVILASRRIGPFVTPGSHATLENIRQILVREKLVPPVDEPWITDKRRARMIIQNVTQRIVEGINQNLLSQWARNPNLFPDNTLSAFWNVFYNENSLPTGNQDLYCYITGGSPIIYLYPEVPKEVEIQVGSPLVYTDPLAPDGFWKVLANPDGRMETILPLPGISRLNLYYEYDLSKVSFKQKNEGFVIRKDEWKSFVKNKIGFLLELNKIETEGLLAEFENAVAEIGGNLYLKVSLIDKEELEKNLPVKIIPEPDRFYRLHFLIAPLKEKIKLQTPKIGPILRDGFVALELGVRVDKGM